MNWTNEEIDSTLRAGTERSLTDSAFRALAISNPAAAIAKVTDKPVPAGFRIQFVDNAKNDLTIVLPDPSMDRKPEVNEEELAGVAGGAGYGFTGGCHYPTLPPA